MTGSTEKKIKVADGEVNSGDKVYFVMYETARTISEKTPLIFIGHVQLELSKDGTQLVTDGLHKHDMSKAQDMYINKKRAEMLKKLGVNNG